jgi:hypothetical protein
MALKTMIENLKKAREAYDKQLAALGENAQKAVVESLAELIPKGKVLVWSQYTPYFNDGEACTFSVRDPYLQDENEDDEHDPYEGDDLPKGLAKAWDALPEDLMEKAFGDHVQVWVKHGGEFSVDECSHD